ncbi:hypothetical protein P8452_20533 [Trifolium repens]|nr:hypothetical protein P8452_20533 [Trifolium repens]
MAIPNRDMVKEHNAEMERKTNTSSLKRTRFEARKNITAPSGSRDAIVETLIYNTSMNFPFRSITYPRISTFLPCFATPMCYLTHMDNLMASTKSWTDNCMGWVPPYSQIYVGILFYIQTFRAMECAGLLLPGSKILTLLNGFRTQYSMNNVYIPGPLVQCFKNISCFSPTATDRFGNVSPSIPARPGWSQDRSYRLQDHLTTHLPHIYLFASRLRSTCNAATRANVTESSFATDVDGPRYLATLFNQPCDHNSNEIANLTGPGASHVYAGNLELWQKAAAQIDNLGCCPVLLDVDEHEVDNNWTSFLGFLMNLLNAVVGRQLSGSLFNEPCWNAPTGTCSATNHKSVNQFGHYSMNQTSTLKFSATTTIEDIPEADLYAASTYNVNLLPAKSDPANYHHGKFWDIVPNTHELTRAQIIPGVLATITREFHSDSRIYPDHT